MVTQSGPFRCINMKLAITSGSTTYVLGVVEGFDMQLGYEGGAEPYYGSRVRKHSAGSKNATFSITRWFYSDTGQQDLLMDLFQAETEFSLIGSLIDNAGVAIATTSTTLTGCRLYKWRPRTGAADDIIGEEASGEATDWSTTIAPP